MTSNHISILDRRRIEAEFAKAAYDVLKEQQGEQTARHVLATVATRLARQAGGEYAQAANAQSPGLADLAELLPLWERDDALRVDYLERTAERLSFNVTRCRYAEMYKELGIQELGPLLSCKRDGEFCQGFNPTIRFERTQTIMEGASHCDFRYSNQVRHGQGG